MKFAVLRKLTTEDLTVEFVSLRGFKLTIEDFLFHSRVCTLELFLAVD